MKTVLISPTPPDISAFGVRSLSAWLKSKGHEVVCVFLPGGIERLRHDGSYIYRYSPEVLGDLAEICAPADLIGISFLTQFFDRALDVTQHLRKVFPEKPLVWGGIHATTCVDHCLDHVDYLCVGEGEETIEAMLERLAHGDGFQGIGNLVYRDGSLTRRGPTSRLLDLDSIPNFDFDLEGHYFLNHQSDRVEPMTAGALEGLMPLMQYFGNTSLVVNRTMVSRGCPHMCTYCSNTTMVEMYKENTQQKYLRWRSWESAFGHFKELLAKYPFIKGFHFIDDTFFALPRQTIHEFSSLWKREIGLPFYTQSSPLTLTQEKMEPLINAGMVYTEMGIQAGNDATKELFNRRESNERVIDGARIVHRYVMAGKLVQPSYHVICDSPWETLEQKTETLNLLLEIPRPFRLALSSLLFFPGTSLYMRAKAEGLLHDDAREIYRKPFFIPKPTYVNFLIYCTALTFIPKPLLRLLARPRVVKTLSRPWLTPVHHWLRKAVRYVEIGVKGLEAAFAGDTARILRFVYRAR